MNSGDITEADEKKEKQRKKAISETSVTNIVGNVLLVFFLPNKSKGSSEDNYKCGKIPKKRKSEN